MMAMESAVLPSGSVQLMSRARELQHVITVARSAAPTETVLAGVPDGLLALLGEGRLLLDDLGHGGAVSPLRIQHEPPLRVCQTLTYICCIYLMPILHM